MLKSPVKKRKKKRKKFLKEKKWCVYVVQMSLEQ